MKSPVLLEEDERFAYPPGISGGSAGDQWQKAGRREAFVQSCDWICLSLFIDLSFFCFALRCFVLFCFVLFVLFYFIFFIFSVDVVVVAASISKYRGSNGDSLGSSIGFILNPNKSDQRPTVVTIGTSNRNKRRFDAFHTVAR